MNKTKDRFLLISMLLFLFSSFALKQQLFNN